MRNGIKVYDADTHIHASAELLEPYLSSPVRKLLPDLGRFKIPIKRNISGDAMPEPYLHWFRLNEGAEGGWRSDVPRHLGEAKPRAAEDRPGASTLQQFMGAKMPARDAEWAADSRIRDMDEEGVDVQVMVPSVPQGHGDPAVNVEFMRANHRMLNDFCGKYPDRLKSLILASADFIDESVEEIRRWGSARWAAGVWLSLPLDYPLDHPDLEPIWAAIEGQGLCVTHHSFSWGYPGYRDLWANPFMARTASHPWGRCVPSLRSSAQVSWDRYPSIRFSILESGFGWLPSWAVRMQDQVGYMGYVPQLQHTMLEYITSGRFFASIVLHEGEQMVRMVNDFLGDHLLMFSSDYPHPESRFPNSADIVLGWRLLGPDVVRKIMWDNAVRCLGEP